MANDPIPVAPVATPVAPVATPVTPVTPIPAAAAPAVVESVSPPSTPTPTPAPAAAAGTPAPVPAPESTTLVGDGLKPTPAPAETVEAAPDKPEGQSEEPAPPPTYDAFALPEGFNFEDDRVKQFTDILGEFETKNKAEHAAVQEFGQKAVDFHVAELKRTAETIYKEAQETWEKTKTEWKDSFMSDPEIGGNRSQTTIDAALSFIRTYGGSPEQQAEFRSLMDTSGVGNHPAMIRLLANAGRGTQEHGAPLAATNPISAPKSRVTTMYGSK